MDDTLSFPIMNADKVLALGETFADDMVTKLNKFNEDYPMPELEEEERERLGGDIPKPNPQGFHGFFKVTFCNYMASRYVIGSKS